VILNSCVTALYEEMTEDSSTVSHLSVAMTTEKIDSTPTTDRNGGVSSALSVTFRFEYAVILIGVVGLAGNALILYALVASKQHKKHMLIVNQNALDLFSSFFLTLTYVVEVNKNNFHLTGALGYWLCMAIMSGNAIWWGTNGSMVNLAIITIDRYLRVVHPIWSKKWLRPWVVYSAIAFSWSVGIAYNTVLVFCTSAVIDGVCYGYSFFDSYIAKVSSVVFYVLFFYFIILVVFIFCYWRILVAIRRQAKVMASHNATRSDAIQVKSQQLQTNVIKTMIFVSAFYAVAWLPNNVYYCLISTELVPYLTFFDDGYYVTAFIAYFYTSSNPFIYATKFDPVRQILTKTIPCKKTSPSSTN